jgi:SAM-dependent methyltransferase
VASTTTRELGRLFDAGAEEYDAARPSYPASLVDSALRRGGLEPGARVLEIGCGTGKLTELLVERGLRVEAVDPGENMVAVAWRRTGDRATFRVGRFEDVELEGPFDAVFAATAFHWIEPSVSWKKVAALLRPGGLLALLQYLDIRSEASEDEHQGFMELLRKYAPDVAAEWREPLELEPMLAGARERRGNASEVWDWLLQPGLQLPSMAVPEAATLFEDVDVSVEMQVKEATADELVAGFRTTSLYRRIDPARRADFEAGERRLVERLGGTVRTPLAMLLMTARRAAA